MNTRRKQTAEQNLMLVAPAAQRNRLRPTLNDLLPAPHSVLYRDHAAPSEDHRLP